MGKYEIVYTVDDGYEEQNIRENFTGTWDELRDYIGILKSEGCYHIDASYMYDIEEYA